MNAVIIDDEPAAITSLSKIILDTCPEVNVLSCAYNLVEALEKIAFHQPDILFLDIQMPGGSGFDLLRQLPKGSRPEVIFVTSQDQFAMQAIKVAALGYLLKPVIAGELKNAVALADDRIRQKDSETRLEALLSNLETKENSHKKIGIPSERGVEFVDAGDIIYCEGEEGYTRIHLRKSAHRLSSYSIGEFRKMLAPYDFFPVHRSYLVNRRHVVSHDRSGGLMLSSGEKVTVSRRRKIAVVKWLSGAE